MLTTYLFFLSLYCFLFVISPPHSTARWIMINSTIFLSLFQENNSGREKKMNEIEWERGTRRAKVDKNRTRIPAPLPAGRAASGSFRPKAYSKHIYIPSRRIRLAKVYGMKRSELTQKTCRVVYHEGAPGHISCRIRAVSERSLRSNICNWRNSPPFVEA